MLKIEFSSLTFKGNREYNQDRVLAKQIGESTWIFAVADGMGGANGGEVASTLVISHMAKYIGEVNSSIESSTLKSVLYEAIEKAQVLIKEEAEKDKALSGMGTTLSCLLIHDKSYVWASIGDSRIYKLNDEVIDQITEDHTYIQEYLQNNKGKLPQNIVDNYAHILTRCIDGKMQKPDVYPILENFLTLEDGETFLLCSDGLITDKMNTNSNLLKNVISGTYNLDEAVKNLVGYAYQMGSKDNISVVVVRIGNAKIKKENIKRYDFPEDGKTPQQESWIKRILNR